ncbi:MBL fold metallo-hydrolase [Streptomyces sp. LARHCF252]
MQGADVCGRIPDVGQVDNNVWIVGDDAEAIVIDAAHDAEAMARALGDRVLRAIVCTHAHDDHVGAASELAARTGAPVLLHPDDHELWKQTLQRGRSQVVADPNPPWSVRSRAGSAWPLRGVGRGHGGERCCRCRLRAVEFPVADVLGPVVVGVGAHVVLAAAGGSVSVRLQEAAVVAVGVPQVDHVAGPDMLVTGAGRLGEKAPAAGAGGAVLVFGRRDVVLAAAVLLVGGRVPVGVEVAAVTAVEVPQVDQVPADHVGTNGLASGGEDLPGSGALSPRGRVRRRHPVLRPAVAAVAVGVQVTARPAVVAVLQVDLVAVLQLVRHASPLVDGRHADGSRPRRSGHPSAAIRVSLPVAGLDLLRMPNRPCGGRWKRDSGSQAPGRTEPRHLLSRGDPRPSSRQPSEDPSAAARLPVHRRLKVCRGWREPILEWFGVVA